VEPTEVTKRRSKGICGKEHGGCIWFADLPLRRSMSLALLLLWFDWLQALVIVCSVIPGADVITNLCQPYKSVRICRISNPSKPDRRQAAMSVVWRCAFVWAVFGRCFLFLEIGWSTITRSFIFFDPSLRVLGG
jgi:hypothetical protein